MIGAALAGVERFLLPNACVACAAPVERRTPDALVCGVCRTRLQVVRGGCSRCHQPTPPVGPCRFCADWPEALVSVSSAVWLGDEVREMVHHLKYEGYTRLARLMAEMIAETIPTAKAALLVPVPLGRRREATRGYNQAGVIADALAAAWSLRSQPELLRRVRETASQTGLDPERRTSNVKGAFAGRAPSGTQDETGLVILVDDVLTTGATMATAAAALSEAGWKRVGGITFARAPTYDKRALARRAPPWAPTDEHSFTFFSRPV